MRGNTALVAFNRGLISRLALCRVDLDRTALAAEDMTNWMPRALGSMMLRPGFGYLGSTRNNLRAKNIPFVFSANDHARIELTNQKMRVWVNDVLVTRPTVTAAITNGTFTTDLSGWTDDDQAGGVSVWATGGYMSLSGNGSDYARRRQQVTVNQPNVIHALRIVVNRGFVLLRVGSASGTGSYIEDTSLGVGTHSITLTPTGNFHIQLANRTQNVALVDSIAIESAGVMEVDAPWLEADLSLVRHDQSGDVIFVACSGYQPRRIERRSVDSWSVVHYAPEDGPFRIQNTGTTRLTASALFGNITLLASASTFKSGHVGALFSITSVGQKVQATGTGDNQFSDSIRVTGVGSTRIFTIEVSGTFVATIHLQRSVGDVGAWEDITSYTAPFTGAYDDGLANQIIYYRLGIKTGNYTSGSAVVKLTYTIGSLTGVVRITSVTDELNAAAEVLKSLGGTTATDVWAEGAWSTYRGYPSAVVLHDGRLFWAGKDRFNGSITDAFNAHDRSFAGDAGPIFRSIGSGPMDVISWLISVQRLIAGTDGSEISCRSSSFDEPLTPTNFTPKATSTLGSARVAAVKVDDSPFFVQACGKRVYQLDFSNEKLAHIPVDMTALVPDIGSTGIVAMAVQRQPDTRLHCVRADGKVAVLVFDQLENVRCWCIVDTAGLIEDVCVLPGTEEDSVVYTISRTINGATVRYQEKWATESQGRGAADTRLSDAHKYVAGPVTTVTDLGHLEGASVVAWGNGKDLGTYTVTGGAITLTESATGVTVGRAYEAFYKSTKLAYFSPQNSSALTQKKRVDHVGFVLADTHAQGIRFGQDYTTMDGLPLMENYAAVDQNSIWVNYDEETIEFPGEWTSDSRVCLKAASPRPVTVVGLVIGMTTSDKM